MSQAQTLVGKTALVTGATGVIGRHVCAQLTAAGATLLVHCRSQTDMAEQLAAGKHQVVAASLDEAAGVAALGAAVDAAGGVDILVNTVHLGSGNSLVADLEPELLRAHLDSVMLQAALSRVVVPGMRAKGWGRIVYVSGALMARPSSGMGGYGASKAAASTLTRYLALEEGRAGITANIVAPGRVVDPELQNDLEPDWARLAASLAERTAFGRFPTPDEVASAVVGLTLPGASGITGQTILVTGGEPIN